MWITVGEAGGLENTGYVSRRAEGGLLWSAQETTLSPDRERGERRGPGEARPGETARAAGSKRNCRPIFSPGPSPRGGPRTDGGGDQKPDCGQSHQGHTRGSATSRCQGGVELPCGQGARHRSTCDGDEETRFYL